MWWVWALGALAVVVVLVVLSMRRGNTGIDGYRPKDSSHEGRLGAPPGQWGDGGGGF